MCRVLLIGLLAVMVLRPAAALEIEREGAEATAWVVVAARILNVREERSKDAPVAFKLPRATLVALVDASGQPDRVDGQEDTWTLIATETCANEDCTMLRGGWVADSWLAYQERYERLSEWRKPKQEEAKKTEDKAAAGATGKVEAAAEGSETGAESDTKRVGKVALAGEIKGNDGKQDFTFRIGVDGSFEYLTPPCAGEGCEENLEYQGCTEETFREGDFCVGRGDLYRYKSLVWARDYAYLFIDRKGNMCSVYSQRDGAPRMCDR